MLCVLAHGVVNGMEFLGVVVGYIVDFPLPEDWPATKMSTLLLVSLAPAPESR